MNTTEKLNQYLLNFEYPINRRRYNTYNKGETHRSMALGIVNIRPCCQYDKDGVKINDPQQECLLLKKDKYKECFKLTNDWVKEVYPYLYYNFKYSTIMYNGNNQCRKHIDANNVGESYIIGLGDYTGGRLIVYDKKDRAHYVDINNKFVKFNGSNYYHEVEDWVGTRISLVFYNIVKTQDV